MEKFPLAPPGLRRKERAHWSLHLLEGVWRSGMEREEMELWGEGLKFDPTTLTV